MPWVCLPVGRIRHLAPAALAAMIAAHPIPAGVECYCTGTRLAYVPDPGAASLLPPGTGSVPGAAPSDVPDIPLPADYVPPFGWHGPNWTPPVGFGPPSGGGGTPGGAPSPYVPPPFVPPPGVTPIHFTPANLPPAGVPPGAPPGSRVPLDIPPDNTIPPGGNIPPGHNVPPGNNVPPTPPTEVPEPASGAVLLIALGALATIRRRARRCRDAAP